MFKSKDYWEKRYKTGGNSGDGSYGKLSEFKNKIINELILEFNINTVLELGCGDGNQLKGFKVGEYTGVDVSKTIIDKNIKEFKSDNTKKFYHESNFIPKLYDATMSLDVIYHLVEDEIYKKYINDLFNLSDNIVIIYSFNERAIGLKFATHLKHRPINDLPIPNNWDMIKHIKNPLPFNGVSGSYSDFYIFKKINKL